jgi:hypothetical protein
MVLLEQVVVGVDEGGRMRRGREPRGPVDVHAEDGHGAVRVLPA